MNYRKICLFFALLFILTGTVFADVSDNPQTLLVNFGSAEDHNFFGLQGWTTPIKDINTDYCAAGGMTITTGNNGSYNYQGVQGTDNRFDEGDKIVVSWRNNSGSIVTFTPEISFDDPNRKGSSYPPAGTWHAMSEVEIFPTGSNVSIFEFSSSTAGIYSLVNVNVNFDNTETLVCYRIKLIRKPVPECFSKGGFFDLIIESPENGAVIPAGENPCISVTGSTASKPENYIYDVVYINGIQAVSEGNTISGEFCLKPGENLIEVKAECWTDPCRPECQADCNLKCDNDGQCLNDCLVTCNIDCGRGIFAYARTCVTYEGDRVPEVEISADPTSIENGGSSVLSWNSAYADSCTIEPGIGAVGAGGSVTVTPSEPTTYTITATGPGGTASAGVTVSVSKLPAVTFSADPGTIQKNQSSVLTWTSSDADIAYIDNGIGTVPVNGSVTVSPDHTSIYNITVTGLSGLAYAQAVVRVAGGPAPLPENSFGKPYEDLVPDDASIEEYDPKRFSVITGQAEDSEGSPLADVSVTVLGHPEYGTVLTDSEGRFSIPAEGGSVMTVVYRKQGLLISHRQVHVPWNDIAVVEKIVMIPEDTKSTTVVFDGNPDTVVTHSSTLTEDEFGKRSCTMVFTGDNRAFMTDVNGNDIAELKTVTTRATEYFRSETMPAKLPPTSAYTYCAELSVDGAQNVRFEKPVAVWVENFLGFEPGEGVPAGYYDRNKGVWTASENGIVVRLLDKNGDGIADGADVNEDGNPDDINKNGSTEDEVTGLTDSEKFRPGDTYWRVPVSHFSPWDFNWCSFISLLKMLLYGSPETDGQKCGDCKEDLNSFVEQRSRIFHEDIPVPGTDITLHYASSRAEGYMTDITVPAGGDSVPNSVKEIKVRVEVAGRIFEDSLPAEPNQKAEFSWDGKDFLGNPVHGTVTARTSVGFVYNSYYMKSGYLKMSFAMFGTEPTEVPSRKEVITWQHKDLKIHRPPKEADTIADGWGISGHHLMSPGDKSSLHSGNGLFLNNSTRIITTVAGTGTGGYSGDGGPAAEAGISAAFVYADSEGNLYISEFDNHRIRKIDTDGIITTVAGNGLYGYSGDGGPAVYARLDSPTGVAKDVSGNLYIADLFNHRIRKIDTDGIITTVAGTGEAGYNGDEIPAGEAKFYHPARLACDASGSLYIADYNNHRVRKIDTNGIISTVAGTGVAGYTGDGGPSVSALIDHPTDVAADLSGNIYITSNCNHRVRKIDTSGNITTIAGSGAYGSTEYGAYEGDGGPADEARLNNPYGVTADAQGNIYIADRDNNCIRKVGTNGIITTVVGNANVGYGGDGGPATRAQLDYPKNAAVGDDGNLYIADQKNHRIRKVAPASESEESAGNGEILFPDDSGTGYVMSASGRHERTIDLDTGTVLRKFGYDSENRLVTVTDRFENQVRIERNAEGVPVAVVSPDNITTNLAVDGYNQLTRVTFPDTHYYNFEYEDTDPETDNDNMGLMKSEVEPNGNRFDHIFDISGRITDIKDEEDGLWTFTRETFADGDILYKKLTAENNETTYLDHTDSAGYTSVITNSAGGVTNFSRSADGLTVTKSLPCGTDLEFSYGTDPRYRFKYADKITEATPAGLKRVTTRNKSYEYTDSDNNPDVITETVAVNNKETALVHNVADGTKIVKTPENRTVTTAYDPVTLLTDSVSVPGLLDTAYGYDTRGRLKSVKTGARETKFDYDTKGNLDFITDPENHTTDFDYDEVGRLKEIHRPDMTDLYFDYDENGNMEILTVPKPEDRTVDHSFGYNNVNLRNSYTTPLIKSYSYTYDKDRRLIRKSFPSGDEINYIYEPQKNRLEQIQTPEGNIDFTYYPCGTNVETIAKGGETLIYGYDASFVTKETSAGTLNQSLDYKFNNDFALENFTYAGSTVNYAYDNDGLLTGAGNFTITRKPENGLPEAVTGGNLNLVRTFNGYGETESQDYTVNSQEKYSWSVTRDDNGKIRTKTETAEGVTSEYVYDYDPMGRLLTVKDENDTLLEEYRYDPNGTRYYEMNTHRGIAGRDLVYQDDDCLMTAGDTEYEYNTDGFLERKTDTSGETLYDYSSRGELLSVTLPDSTFIEYSHDPLGRRIEKKINGTAVEKYLWQGRTRLLAVYDGSDSLKMRFEYAEGRMPVSMSTNDGSVYLTYDQVGSLRIVADISGTLVKKLDYDSFGNIISPDTNPAFEIPFGFAGGLHDRDTGLVRFGFRDYDPDVGRWTAKDPILFAGGDTDLYGYCMNDPINFTDIYGLEDDHNPAANRNLYDIPEINVQLEFDFENNAIIIHADSACDETWEEEMREALRDLRYDERMKRAYEKVSGSRPPKITIKGPRLNEKIPSLPK